MTFSVLCRDPETGALGGVAATGSLCVGGWVLRGGAGVGVSASQGTAPSTLWGDVAQSRMAQGIPAADVVAELTEVDAGASHRQLAALDASGSLDHFTGDRSIGWAGARTAHGAVAVGNMLVSSDVLDAALDALVAGCGRLDCRLLAALEAGARLGGDRRGLLSAALLVVRHDTPPLTLRIDRSEDPLTDLRALHAHVMMSPYIDWLDQVPTLKAPFRAPPE